MDIRPLRILLVDDHEVVRQGLRRILALEFPEAEFGEAASAREAFDLARSKDWELLITDITMPEGGGMELFKNVRATCPGLPVLVLSIHAEDQFAIRFLKAGAAGYLNKNSPAAELIAAVRKTVAGGRYVSAALAERLAGMVNNGAREAAHETLSDREFEVLRLIASGKQVKEIAAELHLSVSTVSTYRTRLLEKLNVRTTSELMRYAIDHGLV